LASIYKLFEYKDLDNPIEITKSRITLIETITTKNNTKFLNEISTIENQPKDVRLLSQKLLIEKFNKKYSDLNELQKNLLKEYIGNVSNTNNLKSFVQTEASTIRNIFKNNIYRVKDSSLKIKLNEVITLLDQYDSIKFVDESHISSLLRYYSIIDDLDWSK
jgi:hypothetical protein